MNIQTERPIRVLTATYYWYVREVQGLISCDSSWYLLRVVKRSDTILSQMNLPLPHIVRGQVQRSYLVGLPLPVLREDITALAQTCINISVETV